MHSVAPVFGAAILCVMVVAAAPRAHEIVLVHQHPDAVLTVKSPGAEGNKYGFEGGRVVKVGGVYHLFTSEMIGDPIWVKMRLAHWRSTDRLHWTRVSTLYESSGEFEGKDPRASLWSPLPVYDEDQQRWNLFYVTYRAQPNTAAQFRMNEEGRIWRAVSTQTGREGIGGPYRDVSVILEPGPSSESWEGLQGTDSFFPYRTALGWLALYGSANTESVPIQHWRIGLASAPTIGGPWARRHGPNLAIEPVFIENPIVEKLPDGTYAAVYDTTTNPDAIGYTFSADGVEWSAGRALVVQPAHGKWSPEVRTPLGLVAEEDGTYTIFYTGFEQPADWTKLLEARPANTFAIGLVTVKITNHR
jgi:hypothetical protein